MEIGPWLRDVRLRAGLSQADVAGRIGVGQSAVSRFERGLRTLSVMTLERLLAAMGHQLTWQLEPLWADIDRQVDELAAKPYAERASSMLRDPAALSGALEGIPHAFDGTAAAFLQGAPLPVSTMEVIIPAVDDVARRLALLFRKSLAKVHDPEDGYWKVLPIELVVTMMLSAPTVWRFAGWDLEIRPVPPETFAGFLCLRWGDCEVQVVPLVEIQASDARMRAVLARMLER